MKGLRRKEGKGRGEVKGKGGKRKKGERVKGKGYKKAPEERHIYRIKVPSFISRR